MSVIFKKGPQLHIDDTYESFTTVISISLNPTEGVLPFMHGILELRQIGRSSKKLRDLCHTRTWATYLIRRNFETRISSFKLCPRELSLILRLTGSVIGGSLTLQCATGDFYGDNNSSDIDIYIPFRFERIVRRYINSCGYQTCEETSQKLNIECSHGYADLDGCWSENIPIGAFSAYFHHKTGQKIDCLIMKPDRDPIRAIQNYDFTFLMNYYDGKKFCLMNATDVLEKRGYYNEVRTSLRNSKMMYFNMTVANSFN